MDEPAALTGLAIIVAIVSFPCAIFLERLRRRRGIPNTRPYAWGFFQGISGLIWGALIAVAAAGAIIDDNWHVAAAALVAALAYIGSGWGVIRRYRWAWVPHTVLSLNPLWWIINSVYLRNRWREMAGTNASSDSPFADHLTETRPRRSYALTLNPTQIRIIGVAVALMAGFLLWQYAAIADRNVQDEGRSYRRIQEMQADLIMYEARIDSIRADTRRWAPLSAGPPDRYIEERLERNRQNIRSAEGFARITQSLIDAERAGLNQRIAARERRGPWYVVSASVLMLSLAILLWFRSTRQSGAA